MNMQLYHITIALPPVAYINITLHHSIFNFIITIYYMGKADYIDTHPDKYHVCFNAFVFKTDKMEKEMSSTPV
uniref:Uncharacterized protein n=1 Tax=Anguilla anguilla TaxID=7936 RepID=A0A0E9WW01_ANGAN